MADRFEAGRPLENRVEEFMMKENMQERGKSESLRTRLGLLESYDIAKCYVKRCKKKKTIFMPENDAECKRCKWLRFCQRFWYVVCGVRGKIY